MTSREPQRVGQRFLSRCDLPGEDPLVDEVQCFPEPRPRGEPEGEEVIAGEELARAADPVDPPEMDEEPHRALEEGLPGACAVGACLGIAHDEAEEISEQWEPAGKLLEGGHLILPRPEEANLLPKAHLRQAGHPHVLPHEIGHPLHVPLGKPQPEKRPRRDLRPEAAVPAHVPPPGTGKGGGLPHIVEEDAQLEARVVPQEIAHPKRGYGVGEHVPLGVVLLGLGHAAEGGDLGEHRRKKAQAIEKEDPLPRAGGGQDANELVTDPFPGDGGDPRSAVPDRGGGLLLDREPKLAGEPHRTEHAQAILVEPRPWIPDRPHAARHEVGDPPYSIEDLAVLCRHEAVHGEVTALHILIERSPPHLVWSAPVAVALFGAKRSHFVGATIGAHHHHHSEPLPHGEDRVVREQAPHLGWGSGGRDVYVLSYEPLTAQLGEDGIAHHPPHEDGGMPRLPQPMEDLRCERMASEHTCHVDAHARLSPACGLVAPGLGFATRGSIMEHELLRQAREHMARTLDVLQGELAKIHTGRANPALVENVMVDYYGAPTPLKHVAHAVAPDPDLIMIRPFDRTQIPAIEKAVLGADLGLNPQNDGQVIRIKVPRLTEERRNGLVKLVGKKVEEAKVALRNIRRDAREKLDQERKEGRLAEDDLFRLREELDAITAEHTKQADALAEKKAHEMRTL